MEEDDYLLSDSDDIQEDFNMDPNEGENIINEDETIPNSEEIVDKPNESDNYYDGKLNKNEEFLNGAYDSIVYAAAHDKDNAIEDAVVTLLRSNPKHTSAFTVNNIKMELLHTQSHARMQNSVYTPSHSINSEDISIDLLGDDDLGFNQMYAEEARNMIARFVDYLANRDYSKDSLVSMRQKKRHLPAFIIFLFSSGMYDYIINCPTMPKEYDEQIKRALEKIVSSKYDIVEHLAEAYDKAGRPQVADRVRKLKLTWFTKEPAEILTTTSYNDLNLTQKDVVIYREYRSKYMNISKSITQDAISDWIMVVQDKRAHTYEILKDKTRGTAIEEVKKEWIEWSKKNGRSDSDLANKIIWNKTEN